MPGHFNPAKNKYRHKLIGYLTNLMENGYL
jgi:hypothetical protein